MNAAAHHEPHGAGREVPVETWTREQPRARRVDEAERRPALAPAKRRRVKAMVVFVAVVLAALFGHASRWGLQPLLGSELWPGWIGFCVPLALVILAHVARIVLMPPPGNAEEVADGD